MAPVFDSATTGTEVARIFASAIQGRTILITGVSPKGLGGTLAATLSRHSPKALVLASRTPSKIEAIIADLKAQAPHTALIPVTLDLSSQKSCREAAAAILAHPQITQLDLIFNNAGVMDIIERELSPDGVEMQFATNFLGHFLLTNLLMPKILAAARVNPRGTTRIVNVSSRGAFFSPVRFSDINLDVPADRLPKEEQPAYEILAGFGDPIDPATTTYRGVVAYGQSKTANILFALALSNRLYEKHGVLSLALHPGTIPTELTRTMDPAVLEARAEILKAMYKTYDQGIATSLVAALDDRLAAPGKDGKGVYLSDCVVDNNGPPSGQNPEFAERLWALAEKLVGERFEY